MEILQNHSYANDCQLYSCRVKSAPKVKLSRRKLSEIEKFLQKTRHGPFDNNWLKYARKFYKTSLSSNMKVHSWVVIISKFSEGEVAWGVAPKNEIGSLKKIEFFEGGRRKICWIKLTIFCQYPPAPGEDWKNPAVAVFSKIINCCDERTTSADSFLCVTSLYRCLLLWNW